MHQENWQASIVEEGSALAGHSDVHGAWCTSSHARSQGTAPQCPCQSCTDARPDVHGGTQFPNLHLVSGDRKCRDTVSCTEGMMHPHASVHHARSVPFSQFAYVEWGYALPGHRPLHAAMMHQCISRRHAAQCRSVLPFPSLHLQGGDRKCRDTILARIQVQVHAPTTHQQESPGISQRHQASAHRNQGVAGPTRDQSASTNVSLPQPGNTRPHHASGWLRLLSAARTTRGQGHGCRQQGARAQHQEEHALTRCALPRIVCRVV